MKKTLFVIVLAAVVVSAALTQEFSYVGAQKCQICHRTETQGRQFPIWEASAHAKSFEALGTPAAAELAKQSGLTTPAAESPACLACHAPLAAKAPDLKAEGVGCEACHGPGSEYRKLAVMKDKDAAVKSGLVLYGTPEKMKAGCLKCHVTDHGKVFDTDAGWAKIKHPIPKG
ncbi:MAG TPA: multiheme c-type cytochrome [Terriglobales bacterium]|nr:multiheme c-type cytochrome [Terriglobales bacterium]